MHRVLILYPEHSFRKTLWLALVKMGYEVFEAVNIHEATKLHRCLPADALVADLRGRCEDDLMEIRAFHRNHLGFRVIQFSPQRDGALDSDSLKRKLSEILEAHTSDISGGSWLSGIVSGS